MKKILCVLLTIIMVLSCSNIAFAADGNAKLYTFYGDGMLFEQNREAVISGTAKNGSVITATLYKDDKIVAEGTAVAQNGEFEVSFTAPDGSYDEYSVELCCNGYVFATLEDVVFGELWIASGQSNMQYPLVQEKTGVEMYKNKEKLGDWLRVLHVPAVTEYKGSAAIVPADPQKDIPGAVWTTGDDEYSYNMSAVAYFFAKELNAELDVPVGVLNMPLGGSVIASWLGREDIDKDTDVKNILMSFDEYYEKDEWVESERSIFYDMTSNYNLKVAPLRHFRVSGMIWYQGESDIIFQKTPSQYEKMFDLMQRSYTELFEYDDGLLPVVYTQLASYRYHLDNGTDLVGMNEGFAEMQKKQPDSRAVVSIYDIPLTYVEAMGAIHPDTKKDIGERMAVSAMGLVYGSGDAYTAPYVRSSEIKDGKIYVTLDNVGDGLVFDGKQPAGFAVAGEDGVFVTATAQITDKNTIVIYNERVENPVSASYSYCLGNMNSNLYASKNGKIALPVSPFVIAEPEDAFYFAEMQWADCEKETVWHLKDDVYTKEYQTWESEGAEIAISSEAANSGENGLKVIAEKSDFSVSPVMGTTGASEKVKFHDECYDYSRYGKIVFNVRNDGAGDVIFDNVKIYKDGGAWYSSAMTEIVIPADGKWYEIEVDIENLYIYDVNFGVKLSNDKLKNISDIEFCFSGENAEISIDSFGVLPEDNARDTSVDFTKIFNIINVVKMFFAELLTTKNW